MLPKPKICSGCGKLRPIWKNHVGSRFCKACWYSRPRTEETRTRTRLKPVSDKKAAIDREYSIMRRKFLDRPENRSCRAKLPGCTGLYPETLTIHHTKGRGPYMLDMSSWIPLCGTCHKWVEEHPREAKALGLSSSRLEKQENQT